MGAARSDLEELLAETRWVNALARRLVGHAANSEDLAQEAWVVALERPPRDVRAKRAWFARVLSNLASQRTRSSRARGERERNAARPEAQHDTDVVERAEASRRLAAHVLALDEPYRSTLLARYFDELEPDEIAQRDALNASTVRSRLERGLAKLRERLERDGGREWMSAFVPLARGSSPTAVELGTASATGSKLATATLSGPTTALIGVSVMTIAMKVTLGLAVLSVGAWWLWPNERGLDPTEPVTPSIASHVEKVPSDAHREAAPEADAPQVVALAEPIPATDAAADPSADPLEVERNTEVPIGVIEGLVVRGREPVDGGRVYFWLGYFRTMPRFPTTELGDEHRADFEVRELDSFGRFRITGLDAGEYWIGVDTGAGVETQCGVSLKPDQPGRRVVIELGSARVEGFVYDVEGRPIEGAAVRVDLDVHGRNCVRFGETDHTGKYVVDELVAGAGWVSLDSSGSRNAYDDTETMQRIRIASDSEVRRLDFGSPIPPALWTGRILTRGGAHVACDGKLGHGNADKSGYTEVAFARGAFTLRLSPGVHPMQISLDVPHGDAERYLALGEFEVFERDFERDLTLPGTTVEGRILGFEERSLPPGTTVSLWEHSVSPALTCRPAADGTFRFYGLAAREWRVTADTPSEQLAEELFTVLESDLDLSITLRARDR